MDVRKSQTSTASPAKPEDFPIGLKLHGFLANSERNMAPKSPTPKSNDLFRQRLDELVNLRHPLAQLAGHIDWSVFEREWACLFPSLRGRPATAPRLIAGLLYLQHTYALSDEDVVWGWVENPYWQLFCGGNLVPAPTTD